MSGRALLHRVALRLAAVYFVLPTAVIDIPPKGPCTGVVYTWPFKRLLYPYFGVYVCTI